MFDSVSFLLKFTFLFNKMHGRSLFNKMRGLFNKMHGLIIPSKIKIIEKPHTVLQPDL